MSDKGMKIRGKVTVETLDRDGNVVQRESVHNTMSNAGMSIAFAKMFRADEALSQSFFGLKATNGDFANTSLEANMVTPSAANAIGVALMSATFPAHDHKTPDSPAQQQPSKVLWKTSNPTEPPTVEDDGLIPVFPRYKYLLDEENNEIRAKMVWQRTRCGSTWKRSLSRSVI